MIGRVQISNFKGLRKEDIRLKKFNVLIGPNASGKSNFLDCLVFLSQTTMSPVSDQLSIRGGYERVVFAGREEESIRIRLNFILEGHPCQYDLLMSKHGIISEKLYPDVVYEGKYVINRDGEKGEVLGEDGIKHHVEAPKHLTFLSRFGQEFALPRYCRYLSSWRLYNFVTSAIRKPVLARKSFDLTPDGSNLAQVLLSLRSERIELFYQIQNVLKQGIPGIEELLSPLTPNGETYVAIRETRFKDYVFDYRQLSDGTLRLLAYIAAISAVEQKLVCFEEPENFVHPRLLELLVEILKKSDKQVILSTHSPYLLNFVEPEDVLIFENKEGETRVGKIESMDRIKKHLAEIGLGELWYSGEVGGVP